MPGIAASYDIQEVSGVVQYYIGFILDYYLTIQHIHYH